MLNVKLICVGKMREKFYIDAFAEYTKRLQAYCRLELLEIAEQRLGDRPSEKEIAAALEREGQEILKAVPPDAYVVALCVEGGQKAQHVADDLPAPSGTCHAGRAALPRLQNQRGLHVS